MRLYNLTIGVLLIGSALLASMRDYGAAWVVWCAVLGCANLAIPIDDWRKARRTAKEDRK